MQRQRGKQFREGSSYYRKRNRKIRVICYDPDATDSSSDDEANNKAYPHKKRFVREITIKIEADNKPAEKKMLRKSKHPGVRQRQWGNWAAEIWNPLSCVRVWVGTYKTEEEAVRARQLKKAEFEALVASNNPNPGAGSGDAESLVMTHSCPGSLMEMDSSAGKESYDAGKEVALAEEKFKFEAGDDDGLDIQMELDSLFVDDYGQGFEDVSLFDGLLDSDFDLGAWIEDPFNVACCP